MPTTSMLAQSFSVGSHTFLADFEKAEMGINKRLVRLSFGLEKYQI